MKLQIAASKGFLALVFGAVAILSSGSVDGQALRVDTLISGTRLVVVNQPLADATTVLWPLPSTVDDDRRVREVVAGRLTLIADLETAFAPSAESPEVTPAPPVVVAVGHASADELQAVLRRALDGRRAFELPSRPPAELFEGGVERRLGAPGSTAVVRFEMPLPEPGDSRRSSVEVLWDLIPGLLADSIPYLRSRIEGSIGILESRVDPETAELTIDDLRLRLARFGSDPILAAADVAAARRRLEVRRYALLEEHPGAAHMILDRWLAGGENAVRELLFGARGVTVDSVRKAASEWLVHHPGRVELVLPPRVYNPRFAVGPEIHRLENDLNAAVLERSSSPLAVVCLRPVIVPDLDGEITATALTRLARELRTADSAPPFVRVRTTPPMVEAAGPADGFGELMEQLTEAYLKVAADHDVIETADEDGRRRALDLMSAVLGMADDEPSPASILRPGNLALGVVAPDAEAAAEALGKFWSFADPSAGVTDVQSIATAHRLRVAAPGEVSVAVVALDLSFGEMESVAAVTRELLALRAERLWPQAEAEVLAPFAPGRALLLLVVAANGTVAEIEAAVAGGWSRLTADVDEDELLPAKRRVAARTSAAMSGAAGHARRCAATAAGAARWRQPAELELEVLTLDPGVVNQVLTGFRALDSLEITAAGILPIDTASDR